MLKTLILILVLMGSVISPAISARREMLSHGSLPRVARCNYCHSMTYGVPGTANLAAGTTELCLICHSLKGESRVLNKKVLKKERMQRYVAKTNLIAEFEKPFTHPVMNTSQFHSRQEDLPEKTTQAPRHSACVDCHHHHQITSRNKLGPVKTVTALGEKSYYKDVRDMLRDETVLEYELCFKCHSDSANLPLDQKNKRYQFSTGNPSYHPIIGEGKNSLMPSLIPPYAVKKKRSSDISVIACGDCHGNNDENGPRGPHGSIYPYILMRNYNMNSEVPESSFQYALCYKCHDRNSILRNDSFRYHSLHILGNSNTGRLGTSCFTCHNSHGSSENKFLIDFNRDVVFPNISTGQLRFVSKGTFSGECYLNCHNVSHNPKSY